VLVPTRPPVCGVGRRRRWWRRRRGRAAAVVDRDVEARQDRADRVGERPRASAREEKADRIFPDCVTISDPESPPALKVPDALGLFSQSRDEFDLWFKRRLADSTGVDLNDPPPMELPELLSSYEAAIALA